MTDNLGLNLRWQTVLADLAALGAAGLALLLFFVGVTPTRRGFYCADESIRYPFHESTIPNWALYIYTFTIPVLVISVTEFLSHRKIRSTGTFLSRPAPTWIMQLYRSFVDFLFGCVCSQLVTDVGKYSIGRLRPNFIDVCKPNVTLSHCELYGSQYITNYSCQGSFNDAKESRVSFPSGHSSFSAYTMLYVAIYIQMRWTFGTNRSYLRLLKAGVQIGLILVAYYTALSRVTDNKHHWSDVSAGALIGVVSASLTARYVSNIMGEKSSKEENSPYSINSSAGALSGVRRPQSNYDLEAQQIPKDQPGEH